MQLETRRPLTASSSSTTSSASSRQTLQGADILAAGDHERPYRVFMPDFFDGHPADISWYPPDTPEKGKKLGEFFAGPAAPPKTLERIPKVLEALGKECPDIKAWVGF